MRSTSKTIVIGFICLLLLASGFGVYLLFQEYYRDKYYEEALNSLSITFKDELKGVLEYGEPFHPEDFVLDSSSTYEVEGFIDSYQVGNYTVKYTVKDKDSHFQQEVEKTFSYPIEVVDTKEPIIEIKKESLTITQGEKYDVLSNIVRIEDVIDGPLEKSTTSQSNSYSIQSDLNIHEAGSYKIEIIAIDRNNLKSEKTFTVVVEEEKQEETPQEEETIDTTDTQTLATTTTQETVIEETTPTPSVPQNTPTPTPKPTATSTPKPTATPTPTNTYNTTWNGSVLTAYAGRIQGPSGVETYYNLNMDVVVKGIQSQGISGEYWVREDGVKMYGNYVICACGYSVHPKYSTVQTSLGIGICADTGGFANSDPYQIDIATNW